MSKCKYCNEEIVWLKTQDGRNQPTNMDGSPHKCKPYVAGVVGGVNPRAGATIPDNTQKHILWCWAVGQAVAMVGDKIQWEELDEGVFSPEPQLKWVKSIAENLARFVEEKSA